MLVRVLCRSAERTRALQLCGWGWGWENALAGVERAEAEGTPCRAAALAAFQLRVRAALDVLGRAREPALRVAALALAGLSDERLWRDAHAHARQALPDPYLRALLRFLAASAPAHPQAPPASPPAYPDLSAVLVRPAPPSTLHLHLCSVRSHHVPSGKCKHKKIVLLSYLIIL